MHMYVRFSRKYANLQFVHKVYARIYYVKLQAVKFSAFMMCLYLTMWLCWAGVYQQSQCSLHKS